MSYTVYSYLVDLPRLRALYGSHDDALLTAVEAENADVLREDETPVVATVMREGLPPTREVQPLPTPTLRAALREILAGTVLPVENGDQYWYAVELLCAHVGVRLPNEQFEAINGRRLGILEELDGLQDLALQSRQPLPLPLPAPADFPAVTYVHRGEARAILTRLPAVHLSLPYDDAGMEEWDDATLEAWEREWPKRLQVQYRLWLEEATRAGRDLIAFLY